MILPPIGPRQVIPPVRPPRPADVDTGLWLWLTALVLLLIGQVSDALTAPTPVDRTMLVAVTGFIAVTVGVVIGTLLFLVRSGYRWSRSALNVGGVFTIVYTAMNLFGIPRGTLGAVIFAVTGIFGAVFIGGGIYLLYRPDSQRYFDR